MSAREAFDDVYLLLLWTAEQLTRPSLANLTESYQSWAWRRGFLRGLERAEDRGLIRREQRARKMVHVLTEPGRLRAMGGRDVTGCWGRRWDGKWRQVLFDLPAHPKRARVRLWRWLRANGFGYLQKSVWITPDPIIQLADALSGFQDDVESLVLMEATCCPGYDNQAIVVGSWNFEEINNRYEAYLAQINLSRPEAARLKASPMAIRGWLARERVAWGAALASDPLLPRALWPDGYRGPRAWEARQQILRRVASLLAPRS